MNEWTVAIFGVTLGIITGGVVVCAMFLGDILVELRSIVRTLKGKS